MRETPTSVTLQKKIVTTQGPKYFFYKKKNEKVKKKTRKNEGSCQCMPEDNVTWLHPEKIWNLFEDRQGGTRSMYPKSEF